MKINKFKIIPILLILISFLFANNCLAKNSKHPKKPPPQYNSYELLVKFNEGTSQAEKNSARKVVKAKLIKKIKSIDVELWKLPDDITVEDAINALSVIPSIKYAEPNYYRILQKIPNDTSFNLLWYLNNTGQNVNGVSGTSGADISAPEAWDIETGSHDVVIAVIDSGFPNSHPDLFENGWRNVAENVTLGNNIDDDNNGYVDDYIGWDFVHNTNLVADFTRQTDGSGGHGSHVAGIIASQGNNGTGTTGVMWDAQIMPLKAFDYYESEVGNPQGTVFQIIDAIEYAVNNGAKIINMSFVRSSYSSPEFDAISYANDNGVLVVCAAGNQTNSNDSNPYYPASYNLPNIISVAATNELDELAAYSNYGVNTVHVAAPGGHTFPYQNIYSTLPPDREIIFSEDFESGGSKWNVAAIYEFWGLTYDSFFGSNVVSDSAGNYANNELSDLTTNEKIQASNCYGLYAEHLIDYYLETSYDYAYLQYSTDGINFSTIKSYTGSSGGINWEPFYWDGLSTTDFYLRYRLYSDFLNTDDGVYIDDIELSCVPWVYNGDEYGYKTGTSMAAPVVAGIAGLIWSKYPELTHLEVKDAILNSVDPLVSLDQKVVTGGRVNALQALLAAAPPTTTTTTTLPPTTTTTTTLPPTTTTTTTTTTLPNPPTTTTTSTSTTSTTTTSTTTSSTTTTTTLPNPPTANNRSIVPIILLLLE